MLEKIASYYLLAWAALAILSLVCIISARIFEKAREIIRDDGNDTDKTGSGKYNTSAREYLRRKSRASQLRALGVTDSESSPLSKNNQDSDNSQYGLVYVLHNPDIPGLVKVGFTRRSAEKRAKELSGSGVPGEYKVVYEERVDDPQRVEKRVHERLSEHRVAEGEFFEITKEEAVTAIKRAA